MPPFKQPTDLQSLAVNAAAKLFITSCINIDNTSSESDVASSRSVKIETVRRVIFEHVAHNLCDRFFCAVESYVVENSESFPLKDYRLFYSLLIHANVRQFRSILLRFYDVDVETVLLLGDIDHTGFWLEQIPSFGIVRSLDLTFLRYEATEIFRLVGTVCTELEDISFNTDDISQTLELLAQCRKLRSFTFHHLIQPVSPDLIDQESVYRASTIGMKSALELFPNLESWVHDRSQDNHRVVATMDPDTRLNLRCIDTGYWLLESFCRIATVCPRLDTLSVRFDNPGDCFEMTSFLATRPLVITDLTMTSGLNYLNNAGLLNLFKIKGRYLKKLALHCPFTEDTLRIVAMYCDDLVELDVQGEFSCSDDVVESRSVLTSLDKVIYKLPPDGDFDQMSRMLAILLPSSSTLSKLFITVTKYVSEDDLIGLGNAFWFPNLSRLELDLHSVPASLVRHFYEKGTKLTRLRLGESPGLTTFMEEIGKEVKNNNYDFKIVWF